MTPTEKNELESLMLERECEYCQYFVRKGKRCTRGMDNCILLIFEKEDEEEADIHTGDYYAYGCSDCPYGKGRPCVSSCMRQIERDWRKGRKSKMR